MGGGGKGGGKKVDWSEIFGWAWATGGKLWEAIDPIWSTIDKIWDSVKPLWNSVKDLYHVIKDYILDLWNDYIKPAWNLAHLALIKIDWMAHQVGRLYNETIGRIEKVYDRLFGHIEELRRRFENTRDKILRLINVFNKDLARKIYDETEKLENRTIGRIRNLRDELLHKIDGVYTELRGKLNDFYYAVKDLVAPIQKGVLALQDFLGVAFEKPNLLSKDTIITSADTYGQEWWDSISRSIAPRVTRETVRVTLRGDLARHVDKTVTELDKGKDGSWADVYNYIDDAVSLLDIGEDPQTFEPDTTLMSRDELKEYTEVPKAPDNPETIAEKGE